LEMLLDELCHLDREQLKRLRIFSHGPQSWLPTHLRAQTIAYSARFDGPCSPNPGTKSDFVQRVGRHFVTEILPRCPKGSAADHQFMVDRVMDELPAPQTHARTRLTDEAIMEIIRRDLELVEGRSSRMLRHLRDDLSISCEQGRFRNLFRRAAALD